MSIIWCTGCFSFARAEPPLCSRCRLEIKKCELNSYTSIAVRKIGSPLLGYSFFGYQGFIRHLLLRAKFSHDHQALQVLMDCLANQMAVDHLLAWCDVILPAPPSIRGQLRGQYDIANYWATELGKHWKKPVIRWPLLFPYVRVKKKLSQGQSLRILIVDDILTTGHTVSHITESIACSQIRFSVIAAAANQES